MWAGLISSGAVKSWTRALGIGLVCATGLAGCTLWSGEDAAVPAKRARPNLLLIVIDDLGYSDLGVYGGEIPTPNIDALARSGLQATDFYVSSRGAPTRAMLLTGVDNHVAGFGSDRTRMAKNQLGQPGYEGELSSRVVTLASLLRDGGYHTIMSGKWELGDLPRNWPSERGFERSFALHDNAASHWADMRSAVPGRERAIYSRDGLELEQLPEDYFSTRDITEFAIASLDEWDGDERPFFLYLSYQAVHGPLAVPEDWRERSAGRYDRGFDAIRSARLLRMKQLALVAEAVQPYPGIPTIPRWSDLSDQMKREQARKMELYAAMLENLDFELGRLLDHLRALHEYGDTLVVLLTDNGAEPGDRGPSGFDLRNREWYAQQFPETDLERWGEPGSFIEYGPAWAQVGMVPFRLFKGTQAEGGIRSPLIVSGPGVVGAGRKTRAALHVMDVMPTFLEVAGLQPPERYAGRPVAPVQGRSWLPLLRADPGAEQGPHDWLSFGFAGDRALRMGHWKLVWMPRPFGTGQWALYRLDRDPAELYNRASDRPGVVARLSKLWDEYARKNGVIVPER